MSFGFFAICPTRARLAPDTLKQRIAHDFALHTGRRRTRGGLLALRLCRKLLVAAPRLGVPSARPLALPVRTCAEAAAAAWFRMAFVEMEAAPLWLRAGSCPEEVLGRSPLRARTACIAAALRQPYCGPGRALLQASARCGVR